MCIRDRCKFRHLLERNKLGKVLLTAVNEHLRRGGIKIAKGTIVDATIIGAPSSTKNEAGKRDPEMHQTAKGQQLSLIHISKHEPQFNAILARMRC